MTISGCSPAWPEILDDYSCTGMSQVRRNASSFFNGNAPFTTLEAIVPYNIAFGPMDISNPGGNDFVVIDRYRKFGLVDHVRIPAHGTGVLPIISFNYKYTCNIVINI